MTSRPMAFALASAFLVFSRTALAGPEDACINAANEAEVLRKDVTKLTKAREKLRVCAAQECDAAIRADCQKYYEEVEAALPSIVLVAQDAQGRQIFDVSVKVDDEAAVRQVDGRPITMDGGSHTFRFERPGAAPVDVRMVLRAGQKNVEVVGAWPRTDADPKTTTPVPATTPNADPPSRTLATVGLVVAGVGVVGLGLGTYFGISASSKQSDANCPDNKCDVAKGGDSAKLRDAVSAGNLSTVFFVAGGVLAAGGLTMFFLAPKGSSTGASARVRPVFGPSSAAIVVEGVTF